jgi:hypothetical protein
MGRLGRSNASLWQLTTFGWCEEVIKQANEGPLGPHDAAHLAPQKEKAASLSIAFDDAYAKASSGPEVGDVPVCFNVAWMIH